MRLQQKNQVWGNTEIFRLKIRFQCVAFVNNFVNYINCIVVFNLFKKRFAFYAYCLCFLFNSNRFREISRLIDIASTLKRNVIRKQLQRHHAERRQQHLRRIGRSISITTRYSSSAATLTMRWGWKARSSSRRSATSIPRPTPPASSSTARSRSSRTARSLSRSAPTPRFSTRP